MMTGKETKEESFYYPAIKEWLSKEGWNAVISAEAGISIPTGPYFPRVTIQPDLVGYKKEDYHERTVCVEVKTSAEGVYQGTGQCAVYKTMSNFIYLALPKHVCDTIQNIKMFKSMGIGLLEFVEHEPVRKEMSPITVNLKFECPENLSIERTFYDQLLNMIRDSFAKQ